VMMGRLEAGQERLFYHFRLEAIWPSPEPTTSPTTA
jgi:hypothetical protein